LDDAAIGEIRIGRSSGWAAARNGRTLGGTNYFFWFKCFFRSNRILIVASKLLKTFN
jgi:hypothetical protein